MLAIRLSPEIEKRLERLAKRTGRTKTWYAREAILNYIGDLEDAFLAERELTAIREGHSRTYTLEEVERSFGLDDHSVGIGKKEPRQTRRTERSTANGISSRTRLKARRSA